MDVFMDWLHRVESFFDFHGIPDDKRLKFAETKLKGTARIRWNNHKAGHITLDTFRHWDDLRAAMRHKFEVPGARQSPSTTHTDLAGFFYCGGIH